MQNENTVILNVLGKDSTILPYRRELAMIAGSTNAAILLNQLLYWYEKMGRKPFFKYKEPPQRKENETDDQYYERVYPYKNGDSWTEELYFTKREFDDALHLIAHNKNNPKMYRDGKRISKREEQAIENGETLYPIKKFIRFWTTRDRLTYYEINDMVGLGKVLSIFFLNNNLQFRKGTKDTLDIIQRILTETTTIHSKECICASERSAGEDGKLNSNDKSLNIQNTTKPTKINKLSKSLDPSNKPLTNSETLRTKSKTFKSKSKPKKEYAPCPEKYEPYLDAWEQYTGRTFQGMNGVYTKGWKTIRKVTLGTFFSKTNTPTIDSRFFGQKFILEDLIYSLKNFALMRNNADYYPKDKTKIKRISLDTFFYNPYNPGENKSYFLACLTESPKLLTATIHDPDPEYTDMVIELFQKRCDIDLSNGGKHHAILCTKKLTKFFEDNKHEINYYENQYQFIPQQVDVLIDVLEKNSSSDKPINPIYIHSDLTFTKLLPNHLKEINAMRVN